MEEIIFEEGDPQKPLAVFIHGVGMNVNVWSDPAEARILGGKYPLSSLIGSLDKDLLTTYHDLRGRGFSLLSWSQSRPAGPMVTAVEELDTLVTKYLRYSAKGIILICHSRGGLIARKWLESGHRSVKGLITLATPHKGSDMAKWAVHIAPLANLLKTLIKDFSKREFDSATVKVLEFLSSRGLKELLPDSPFLIGLKDKKMEDVCYVSAGGTNPDLLKAVSESLPELIAKVVPDFIIPDEMKKGAGDGLVSAASSVLPYSDMHRDFPVNHAEILFDRDVREYVLKCVETI